MIALIFALIFALLTRRREEKLHEFVRRWGFYTIFMAAIEVLWFTALEGYGLMEIAARGGSVSSVIATLAGRLGEVLILRGAWADFAAAGVLIFISLLLEELQYVQLPRFRKRETEERGKRKKYCFVVWQE